MKNLAAPMLMVSMTVTGFAVLMILLFAVPYFLNSCSDASVVFGLLLGVVSLGGGVWTIIKLIHRYIHPNRKPQATVEIEELK